MTEEKVIGRDEEAECLNLRVGKTGGYTKI